MSHLSYAPIIKRGKFDVAEALSFAEQDSVWEGANHKREGVVILPELEREDPEIGRVILKMVSNRYLESSKE